MQFYKVYIGDFPFSELNLIEIEDLGCGQAPAGVIFITREAFNPIEDDLVPALLGGYQRAPGA